MMDNSKEFQLMLDKAIESEPLAFEGFDRTKNVQDQLQEMMFKIKNQYPFALLDRLWCARDCFPFAETWKQLWLAFVMKERFGKMWDGEKWE